MLQIGSSGIRRVTNYVDASDAVPREDRQRISPVICVHRRRVKLHRFENRGSIRRHRVGHVRSFAVKQHRYVRWYEFLNGRQPFPSSRTILLPKCRVWFITTGNIRCGMNQRATEIDCSLDSSSDDFGIGIQANAKQRIARHGRGAKLIEVGHDCRLILMVRGLTIHGEYSVRSEMGAAKSKDELGRMKALSSFILVPPGFGLTTCSARYYFP